jgi:hypothetical protein
MKRERSASITKLKDLKSSTNLDAPTMIAAAKSMGLENYRPSAGRLTLTIASFSAAEQEEIEGYVQQLVDEAEVLCLQLESACPILVEGETDEDELYPVQRMYRAQYHAMRRLRRRSNETRWLRAHIRKARKWLEGAQAESMN